MAELKISLPKSLKEWAERRAESGGFESVSDYICDLIRRDYEQAAKIAELGAAEGGSVTFR